MDQGKTMKRKKVTIEVTRDIIEMSTPNCSRNCAVAVAVEKHLKDGYFASVNSHEVSIWRMHKDTPHEREIFVYCLPVEVRQFISDFDLKGLTFVGPIRFEMTLPIEALADG